MTIFTPVFEHSMINQIFSDVIDDVISDVTDDVISDVIRNLVKWAGYMAFIRLYGHFSRQQFNGDSENHLFKDVRWVLFEKINFFETSC